MSGGSGDVTIGYKYYLGVHMALAHGPLDKITRVEVDRRIAWEGEATGGPITIDAPELFGGDEREGGVSGTVDVEMGYPSQDQNTYLQTHLGTDIPAYRGVACAVLNQCYMGNNPYLKPWSFRAQRIHVTSDGDTQWYNAKAAIPRVLDTADSDAGAAVVESLQEVATRYGFDYVQAVDTAGGSWWPFWTGSETNLYRTYANFASTGTPITFFTGVDSNQGWSRGLVSTWEAGSPLEVTCGEVWAECAQVRDRDSSGVYAMLGPSNSVSGGPWAGSMMITTFAGGPTIDTQLVRSCNQRWLITRLVNSAVYDCDNAYIIIDQNVDGSHKLILKLFTTGAQVEVDFPSLEGKWAMLSWVLECNEPEYLGFISGGYRHTMKAKGECRVVTKEGVAASASNEESIEIVSGWAPLSVTRYDTQTNFTQGRLFYTGAPGGVAFAMVQTGNFQTTAADYTYLDDAQDAFVNACVIQSTDCPNMNPAHIIRECLTDSSWGMGYNAADMDDTAFTAAADTLYEERMGISIVWSREMPLEDFIAEILRHIDAVLYVDRTTGKFVLKLIRDDYTESALVVLDETNVSEVSDARRPTVGELTASVTVNFWDADTGETASVTHHNQALYQLQQGGGGSTTIQYPGFTTHNIANRVAQRDLKALSVPFLSCRIAASREAEQLNIGDAFILDWPDLEINSLVMRVQQMTLGDGRDNTVVIEAAEDVFSTPDQASGVSGSPGGEWTDPLDQLPAAALPRVVTESPYWNLVQESGETAVNNVLADDPDAGFLLAAGGRQANEINAKLQVDSGAGYGSAKILDFAPYAYLLDDVGQTDTIIYVTGGVDLDDVAVGSIAQIEDELVRVDEVGEDSIGTYIVVGRGVLDTTPTTHVIDSNATLGAGDAIVFWGGDYRSDDVQYTASDDLNVRMRTVRGANVLAIADTPVDSVMMQSRAIRPYPPGNLRVDGVSYPLDDSNNVFWDAAITVEWAHRDRLQQTDANLYDYTDGDIGPEAGTEYIVRCHAYDGNGAYLGQFIEDYVGNVTSWSFDSNTDSNWGSDFNSAPDGATSVKIEVWATRGGYESWQAAHVTIPINSAADGEILLEDGTTLLLEDGTAILLEA